MKIRISKKLLIIFTLIVTAGITTAFSLSYFTDRTIVTATARSAKLGTTLETVFDNGAAGSQINSVYTIKPLSVKIKNDGDSDITSDLEITAEWKGDSDINWIAFYPSNISDEDIRNDVISGGRSLDCDTSVDGKSLKITVPQSTIIQNNSSILNYKIVLCDNDYSDDDILVITSKGAFAQTPRGFKDTLTNKLQIQTVLPKVPDASIDWEYVLNDSSNTITLTKYIGSSSGVTVENAYRVKHTVYNNVVFRAGTAFTGNTGIKTADFTDGVVFENNTAANIFKGCTSLTSASNMPVGITDISESFSGCTSLVTAPEIPNSITNMRAAFYGCTALKTVTNIPSGVTDLTSAFYGCIALVTPPDISAANVTSLSDTFNGCNALVSAPAVPSGVTALNQTFYGCSSLKTAPVIPESITNMENTFSGCTSLVTAPAIPVGVTNMGGTFYRCTSLTGDAAIFSSGVTNISGTFSGVTKSLNVYVPADSTTYNNFKNSGLSANITLIGYGELDNWSYSTDNAALISLFSANSRDDVLLTKYKGTDTAVTVYPVYIEGSPDNYEFFNAVLNKYDKNSKTSVFYNNTGIKTVDIRAGAAIKDNHAEYMFYGCSNLTSVTGMPDSVVDMEHTFDGCSKMPRTEELPPEVTNVKYAYKDCAVLANAPEIPDTVQENNAEYMFKGCTTLVTAPEMPEGITSLVDVFSGCTALKNVPEIPDSVTDMTNTFNGCTSLVNAPSIPNSVTNMTNTFSGCTSLIKAPVIPDGVTDMGYTFSGCSKLTTAPAVIPASVTAFEETFSNCSALTGKIIFLGGSMNEVNMENSFKGTAKAVTVYAPCGSTTHTSLEKFVRSALISVSVKGYGLLDDWTHSASGSDVILTKYNGSNTAVTVHDTYLKNNGGTYSVYNGIIGTSSSSSGPFVNNTSVKTVTIEDGTAVKNNNATYMFNGCTGLTSVKGLPDSITDMRAAFYNCSSLSSAPELPYNTTSLWDTFYGCTSLTSTPEIPDSVTNMAGAFNGCTKLTGAAPSIPNGVQSMNSAFKNTAITSLTNIPTNASDMYQTFYGCSKLTTASGSAIPSSVTSLKQTFYNCNSMTAPPSISTSCAATEMYQTFYGCSKLTSTPSVPKKAESLYETFYNCSSLISAASLSDCAAKSLYRTYYNCSSLTVTPTFPSCVTEMYYTFYGCTSLTSVKTLPSALTSMQGTFNKCTSLTAVTAIPDNVTNMGWAFQYCSALKSMPEIPDSVIDMSSTFQYCTSMTSAEYIPEGVTDMGYTFSGCTALTGDIIFLGADMSDSVFDYTFSNTSKSIKLYAPYGSTTLSALKSLSKPSTVSVNDYGSLDDWTYSTSTSALTLTKYNGSDTAPTVHNAYLKESSGRYSILANVYIGVSTSSSGPFVKNTSIKSVDIDSGVSVSSNNAKYMFYGCSALTKATGIPSGVTNMQYTFQNCSSLSAAPSIPSSVTMMQGTFYGCSALASPPSIPSGVTNMQSTFNGCKSLTSTPYFPSGITSLPSTFYGCESLTAVKILPSNLTSMTNTFSGCKALITTPSLPSKVTDMENAFYNCTSLKTITNIPESVTNMWSAFEECTALTTVPDIPANVTDMLYTFMGCTSLVNAPDISKATKLTNLASTFYGCTSLKKAPILPESLTQLSSTFYGCASLEEPPVLPESLTSMNSTFRGCTSLAEPPIIPPKVTDISQAFVNCTSMKGNMTILSENISVDTKKSPNPFDGTVCDIVLFPPYESASYEVLSECCSSDYFPDNVSVSVIYPIGSKNGRPDIPWSTEVDSENKIIYAKAIVIDYGDTYFPLYQYYLYNDEVYQTVIDFASSPFDEPYASVWESFFANNPDYGTNDNVNLEVDIHPNIPIRDGMTELDSLFRFYKIDGRDEYRSHLLNLYISWDMSQLTGITSMKNTFYGSVCLSGGITLPPNVTNVTNFYEAQVNASTISSTTFSDGFTVRVPDSGTKTRAALQDEYNNNATEYEKTQFYNNKNIDFRGITFNSSAYALLYDLNGGEIQEDETVLMSLDDDEDTQSGYENEIYETGTKIRLPDGVELFREGYEFAGWNTDKDAEEGFFEMVMPDKDVTLYAVWIEKPLTSPSALPTVLPTVTPTAEPTGTPTINPSVESTAEPTVNPTINPSPEPTDAASPSVVPLISSTEPPKGTLEQTEIQSSTDSSENTGTVETDKPDNAVKNPSDIQDSVVSDNQTSGIASEDKTKETEKSENSDISDNETEQTEKSKSDENTETENISEESSDKTSETEISKETDISDNAEEQSGIEEDKIFEEGKADSDTSENEQETEDDILPTTPPNDNMISDDTENEDIGDGENISDDENENSVSDDKDNKDAEMISSDEDKIQELKDDVIEIVSQENKSDNESADDSEDEKSGSIPVPEPVSSPVSNNTAPSTESVSLETVSSRTSSRKEDNTTE